MSTPDYPLLPEDEFTHLAGDRRDIEYLKRRAPGLIATLHIKLFADDEPAATGERFVEAVAEDMDGLSLTNVEIYVSTASSAGIVQVQVRKNGAAMLTTRIQIDAGEKNSRDAAVAYVISAVAGVAEVAWGDEISIDVDQAGAGARGLGIHIEFS